MNDNEEDKLPLDMRVVASLIASLLVLAGAALVLSAWAHIFK